jgi:hypothetical protein
MKMTVFHKSLLELENGLKRTKTGRRRSEEGDPITQYFMYEYSELQTVHFSFEKLQQEILSALIG